jgi:putative ABC transport system permease protein
MFRNTLMTALRNLVRHKLYSFINIAGLTVGLTCAIFVILFVRDQLSYDRWIAGTENIYRLEYKISIPGRPEMQTAMISFPAAQAMLDNIPDVQARTRLMRRTMTILIGSRQFPERVVFADPNFLQVIRLPLAAGDPGSVLANPDSAVLSQTAARRYFGSASPLGKTIAVSGQKCDAMKQSCELKQQFLVVTGILRDLPHNSQFQADVIVPNNSGASPLDQEARENWLWANGWSYVRLAPTADPNAVTAKFKAVIDRAVNPVKQMNVRARGSDVLATYLVPLVDAHLSTDRFHGMTPPGSWALVYGFSAIGALILLIACFNFTNLATARAMMRAREIGLRKVVGAQRRQLIIQFLGEALVTATIALVFALALTEMLMPLFDRVLGLPIKIDYFRDWRLMLLVAGLGATAGLLSGIYPALVLSGVRPVATLRATGSGPAGSGRLRLLLVVLQFAVSIGLGIAAAVIFAQISFSRNVDLGFRKAAVVVMNITGIPPGTADSLARALRAGPDIAAVAISDDIPFSGGHNHITVATPGSASTENVVLVPASPDYPKLYGIPLLAGRLLSEQRGADEILPAPAGAGLDQPVNVLINASAARRLGYSPQGALGKILSVSTFRRKFTIVGVIADSKQDGPKSAVEGTLYMYRRAGPVEDLSIRIRDGHTQDALAFIDRTWRAFAPSVAIQRHFLDEDFNKQFQADERQGTLFGVFVGIAIFIACLGLFGLAAFSTERRTREIGLRKTFGARAGDIVWMLLWQFSIPVLIANAIAWPVAWYYLHDWLQGFAYRIPLSPLYFLSAGGVALASAWATVFVHALRVARANPIHALRYE